VVAALAVSCGAGDGEPGNPSIGRANVLLISLDSVRQDFLSCYGRRSPHAPEIPTTPGIDRVASEGARFTRAYSTSSWTLPSHVALMTGQPDVAHAVEMDSLRLAPGHRTLAEELAGAGYRTAGFYSGPYLDPRFGFARGFERYEACYGAELAAADRRERELLDAVREARDGGNAGLIAELTPRHEAAIEQLERISHRDVSSEAVSDAVLAEIDAARADRRPWFVFAHYFDPHYDYVPPPPFDRQFDPHYDGRVTGENLLDDPAVSVEEPTVADPDARRRTISDRDLEHVLALYDGELAWTDAQIGRVLDHLRESGELDRTVVVITSDHGDEFFEHRNLGHRKNLFEESVRIPLILRYPPAIAAGLVPEQVVSLADLFATILELVDIPLSRTLASRSVVPASDADGDDGRWIGRLVRDHPVRAAAGVSGRLMVVQEAYIRWPIKIVRRRLWTDPAGSMAPEVRQRLIDEAERDRRREQMAWIDLDLHPAEPLEAYSRDFDDPRARAALDAYRGGYPEMLALRARPDASEAGEAQLRQLRALGYLGGDGSVEAERVQRAAIPPPELPARGGSR